MKLHELFNNKHLAESVIGTTDSGVAVQAMNPPSRGSSFQPTGGPGYTFRVGNRTINVDTSDIDWDGEEEDIWYTVKSEVMNQIPNEDVAELIANHIIDALG